MATGRSWAGPLANVAESFLVPGRGGWQSFAPCMGRKKREKKQARRRARLPSPPQPAAIEPPASPGGSARARSTRREQLRFFLVFALVAGIGSLAYCFPYPLGGVVSGWLSAYLHGYARLAGAAISVFDGTAKVSGQDIVGHFSLHVSKDCDAMEANILMVAAVVAFPSTWKNRAIGLLAGMSVVTIANVVRLCSLYFVGLRWPTAFDFAHLELWPLLLIAISLGVFVAWTSWTKSRPVAVHAGS